MKTIRTQYLFAAALVGAPAFTAIVAQGADPLPSWNDGEAKQSIVDHVGGLDKALGEAQTKGWTVLDLKNDWETVSPERSEKWTGMNRRVRQWIQQEETEETEVKKNVLSVCSVRSCWLPIQGVDFV